MGDRIVYLVEKLPRTHLTEKMEMVDDEALNALMGEGFEITSTLPDRKIQVNGKTVKAVMLVLRPSGENRGVSLRERDREDAPGRGITVMDEFGNSRSLPAHQAVMQEMSRALRQIGTAGHLGPSGNHNMPGLTIISGEMIGKAFDLGCSAGHRGESKERNPFPAGTPPHTKWLQGFNQSAAAPPEVSPEGIRNAEEDGYNMAQSLADDDIAHCPYPSGSAQKAAWMDGFKRGGGIIR